jgi:hypothetical protein
MRRERESLISRLQERNTEIDNAIQKLQQDWILNQQIITELQKEDKSFSEEDDELSIEYIQQEKSKRISQNLTKRKSSKGCAKQLLPQPLRRIITRITLPKNTKGRSLLEETPASVEKFSMSP